VTRTLARSPLVPPPSWLRWGRGPTPRRPLLTPREREVLGLIAEDSGTARSLSASYAASTPSTATSLNILSKLGVPSRAAATARAAADGLL
jgi:DNA-binding CsgD family transcriptional regulator